MDIWELVDCRIIGGISITGRELEIIDASGSHYEIGHQLGTQCKDLAMKLKDEAREFLQQSNTTLKKAVASSEKYIPYVEKFYPEHLDELRGYADATGIEFEEAFAWIHSWFFAIQMSRGCTDIAVNCDLTIDGNVYSAHNEDAEPEWEEYVVIVRVDPDDAPSFIGVSYGGLFVDYGVNEMGISISGNGLFPNDTRIGIPKFFPLRKVLASKTIGAAMIASTPPLRANSFNNVICDENGEMYSMEGSATDFAVFYAEDGYLVHTNHYLSPEMKKYESYFDTSNDRSPIKPNTIIRQNRAKRLIKQELGSISVDTLKRILSDHVNYPRSICRHDEDWNPSEDRWKTLWSGIIDVSNHAILFCKGNPCEGEYVTYKL